MDHHPSLEGVRRCVTGVMVTLALLGLVTTASAADGSDPACPENLSAEARGNGDVALAWDRVEGADGYRVVRHVVGEEEAPAVFTVTDTRYVDTTTTMGVAYEYTVLTGTNGSTATDDGCAGVEVTAIPVLAAPLAGVLAIAGSVGTYAAFRRRAPR